MHDLGLLSSMTNASRTRIWQRILEASHQLGDDDFDMQGGRSFRASEVGFLCGLHGSALVVPSVIT